MFSLYSKHIKYFVFPNLDFLESNAVEKDDTLENDDIVICPGSDDDEVQPNFVPKKVPVTGQVHHFRNVVERGTIPDAKVIYELKKQRKKLARTANEDFIAINSDEEETLRQEARQQGGEEDEADDKSDVDEDDDEDEDRIQFGKVDYKTKDREKAIEAFRVAQEYKEEFEQQKRKVESSSGDENNDDAADVGHASGTESDDSEDELERWEREQIRKAVRLPSLYLYSETELQNRFLKIDQKLASSSKSLGHGNNHVISIEVDDQEVPSRSFGAHIPTYISSSMKNSETAYDSLNNRKSDIRKQLQASLEDNRQILDRIQMDTRLTKQSIEEFQSREEIFKGDYKFYEETLNFVWNLCECLNGKLEQMEVCEREAIELFKKYYTGKVEQRRKSIKEQNAACLQLIVNHKAHVEEYGIATHGSSVFEFYDFGGNMEKQLQARRHEERMRQYSLEAIVDGLSDDEEDKEDATVFQESMIAIQCRLAKVFAQEEEEYANLKCAIKQFENWKLTRLASYAESFVGQFIPKFVVYYIRHELALWNLFDNTSPYFSDPVTQMDCFRNLIAYSTTSPESALDPNVKANALEVDLDIIPECIDKALIPKLVTLIQSGVWNPMSSRQTTRLVRFLNCLLSTCPTLVDSSESLFELFKAMVLRLEQAIENDVFIPPVIPADFFAKDSVTTRSHYEALVISFATTFFHQQFWQAVKLLRNVISLRHLISDHVLKELALGKILNRLLFMSISRCSADGDAVLTQVTQIVSVIPEDWRTTNPILSKFADIIQQLAEASERTEEQRTKLISIRQQLAP